MKQTFNKDFMRKNCGCYAKNNRIDACSFMQKNEITLSDIVESEIPLKHKFWFVINKCASINERKQIALEAAECVLPIYEEKYQNNKAPRKAIEAAKKYLRGELGFDELLIARQAAAAAYAAADANADDAAADAAYAAYAAADDAADDDAAYAAYAADAAAAAYKIKLLKILLSKVQIAEPCI